MARSNTPEFTTKDLYIIGELLKQNLLSETEIEDKRTSPYSKIPESVLIRETKERLLRRINEAIGD
jgi:hypothetical protein